MIKKIKDQHAPEIMEAINELLTINSIQDHRENLRELMDDYFLNDHGQTDRKASIYATFHAIDSLLFQLNDIPSLRDEFMKTPVIN